MILKVTNRFQKTWLSTVGHPIKPVNNLISKTSDLATGNKVMRLYRTKDLSTSQYFAPLQQPPLMETA